MDDIVKQAIAKWPNVPSVYGWLALDRRGNWLIRNDRVSNPVVAGFINRNYERDAEGRWFFQNGPQRVYVALEYTPLIYRIGWDADPDAPVRIDAHTGATVGTVNGAWIDDVGIVLLETDLGVGMMDDRDLERMLPCFTGDEGSALDDEAAASSIERLQAGHNAMLFFRYRASAVRVSSVPAVDVPAKFGFVQRPSQPAGQEECC